MTIYILNFETSIENVFHNSFYFDDIMVETGEAINI